MKCISPITVRIENKPQVVQCGKCNFCLEKRRNEWSFRLSEELKISKTASFLTLTYSDENLPFTEAGTQSLRKSDCRLFLKRLRKANGPAGPIVHSVGKVRQNQIKYYLCGEYGTKTLRPHYHLIIFNVKPEVIVEVEKIWGLGLTHTGTVNIKSIHYVSGYLTYKDDYPEGSEKPFAWQSKHLGYAYITKNKKYHKSSKHHHVLINGHKGLMPRYFREKIFNRIERDINNEKEALRLKELEKAELRRLKNLVPDPFNYYTDVIRNKHDKIKTQKNQRKKL